tara:strand:+ start:145 stop:552 length:408 start_codon:yes stop_codon:yes gene_type:complete
MEITKERLKEIIIEELQESLEEKQLDEISPRTQYARQGISGIFDQANDIRKMLDKHIASFDDPPDILDNIRAKLDLIIGATKSAIANYMAGSALDMPSGQKERGRIRSQNLALRGTGEKYEDGEFPEDLFDKYKE